MYFSDMINIPNLIDTFINGFNPLNGPLKVNVKRERYGIYDETLREMRLGPTGGKLFRSELTVCNDDAMLR